MTNPQYGTIINVTTTNLGEPLAANAAIAATTLFVPDASTFDENPGVVKVNGNLYAYSAVNNVLNAITLVSGLVAAAAVDDRVEIDPPAPVKRALIDLGVDEGEAVLVTVPHALVPILADGMREDNLRETALLEERVVGQLYLRDIIAAEPKAALNPVVFSDRASGTLAPTTTATLIPGLTHTFSPTSEGAIYFVDCSVDFSGDGSSVGIAIGQLFVDSVVEDGDAVFDAGDPALTARSSVAQHWIVSGLSMDSHTLELRAVGTSGITGYVVHTNTRLTIIQLSV